MSKSKGRRPSRHRKKFLSPKKWAGRILNLCASGMIKLNSAAAIKASRIVGFEKSVEIITRSHQDLMSRRLPGSYGSRSGG